MPDPGHVRIAFFLQPSGPDTDAPRISPLTQEIIARLREQGLWVDSIVPESGPLDLAEVRPRHDLYVLKSETPLALSLAGALAAAGARVVNTFRASNLTRDKVAATAVLAAAGVPVPPSWTTGQPAMLRPLLAEGPLWLKPQRGTRGTGIRRATDPLDLDEQAPPTDPHGLPLPLFAQREVPTSGRDLKVFAAGETLWAISRPFPARSLQEKIGTPAPLPSEIEAAALACGRTLGLELYGVDFLLSEDRFFVVDVNAFPGYKGVADAPQAVADYLYRRALAAHNGCHR
jgi:ribosomal protein S6--L-glutamate ligase